MPVKIKITWRGGLWSRNGPPGLEFETPGLVFTHAVSELMPGLRVDVF